MKDIERERLLIRKYLLGELDERGREQLEQRVITDPHYKEQVLITEEELLEDFVNGTLSQSELESFTRMYSSSPAQRRKVKVAQALNKYALEHSPVVQPVPQRSWARSLFQRLSTKNRFHQFSLAALILVLAVGGVVLYWLISRALRADYNTLLQLNQPNSEMLQPNGSVLSVSLPPLVFRGTDETRNITITKQTQIVQLRLPDPSGGKNSFQAILKDIEGEEVFKLEDLRTRQIEQHSVLVIQIPARMLKPQDYKLEISERRPDGTYEPPRVYPVHVTETQ